MSDETSNSTEKNESAYGNDERPLNQEELTGIGWAVWDHARLFKSWTDEDFYSQLYSLAGLDPVRDSDDCLWLFGGLGYELCEYVAPGRRNAVPKRLTTEATKQLKKLSASADAILDALSQARKYRSRQSYADDAPVEEQIAAVLNKLIGLFGELALQQQQMSDNRPSPAAPLETFEAWLLSFQNDVELVLELYATRAKTVDSEYSQFSARERAATANRVATLFDEFAREEATVENKIEFVRLVLKEFCGVNAASSTVRGWLYQAQDNTTERSASLPAELARETGVARSNPYGGWPPFSVLLKHRHEVESSTE
ncbi:hypothetical protein FIV42_15415 [Persicimonas caeni]|uniref:Uncharacterized protein n=1 Tax=Persicimonas caeni TaxID=2292766 RepID=A0A4Y6PUR8_PERCE|nr:hypothetical protein [Persicimonas caeni]QDG52081.1 hypothetical protein FIV42_15415 [Persicimonas caeni]QED33302.1 hypothetical protein FRD00_15410 [Persicimonas caeni]